MVTLGLLSALKARGIAVQPFKCGPDYIDPAFHAAAAGRQSYNIDSWAMRLDTVKSILEGASRSADLVIVESLMGFFDGVDTPGTWGNGSSADLAAVTGWPVVLVLDVSGQSQTAAAVARGFVGLRENVRIAGVILNRTGSPRHIRLARRAIEQQGLKVFGAIPRQTTIELPERHLGLVQASETADLQLKLTSLATLIETHINIDALIASAGAGQLPSWHQTTQSLAPPAQRIALANDAAFSFVYPHVLAAWREAGAEIETFSPLADEAPPQDADLVWLPGGYPELHACELAARSVFLEGTRAFAKSKPVHGECGGYMVLGDAITDAAGQRHIMLQLLDLETSYADRRMSLGYRKARIASDCPLGRAGATVGGHEFHYSTVVRCTDEPLFQISDADGNALADGGSRRGLVTGSFFHFVDVLDA